MRSRLFFGFLVSALAQYCVPGPYYTGDTNLGATTLTGDSPPGIVDQSNCPGTTYIRDLTSLLAELKIGQTYDLSFNVTTCGGVYPSLTTAWIDYDTDFVFEPEEELFAPSNAFGPQTLRFTVPASSHLGNTRLRLQTQEAAVAPLNPCAVFAYGATKDYSVSIKPAAPDFCETGPIDDNDMNLGPVSLNGFTENIVDDSDCPSVIGGADFTSLIADVYPGSPYTLKLQVTSCATPGSPVWPTTSAAWIDFNQDKNFDSWEQIGVSQQLGLADVSIPFVVPLPTTEHEVLPGNTRMRVQTQETNADEISPCTDFPWGGTKDFTIRVRPYLTYCTSGPTSTARYALGSVTFIGATRNIVDTSDCSVVATGPVDHTNMIADAYPQLSYTLTYDVVNCDGGTSNTMSAAWIDYNQNGLFEGWEQVTPRSTSFGTVSYSFKIPPSSPNQQVLPGPTRLRVSVQVGVSSIDPCALFTNGGARDYTVNILTTSLGAPELEFEKPTNFTEMFGRSDQIEKRGSQKRIISMTRNN